MDWPLLPRLCDSLVQPLVPLPALPKPAWRVLVVLVMLALALALVLVLVLVLVLAALSVSLVEFLEPVLEEGMLLAVSSAVLLLMVSVSVVGLQPVVVRIVLVVQPRCRGQSLWWGKVHWPHRRSPT